MATIRSTSIYKTIIVEKILNFARRTSALVRTKTETPKANNYYDQSNQNYASHHIRYRRPIKRPAE